MRNTALLRRPTHPTHRPSRASPRPLLRHQQPPHHRPRQPPYGAQIRAGFHELTYRARRLRTEDGQALEGINEGEHLTGAIFSWAPGVRYARIMITDDRGRKAWSNPIWAT
jgi:hypothetical protein